MIAAARRHPFLFAGVLAAGIGVAFWMRRRSARFRNQDHVEAKGLVDLVRWRATRTPVAWTPPVSTTPGPAPAPRLGSGALRATFVNHSTFLLQFDGLNLLTDPIWSDRASPVSWAGPKRHRAPGIRFEDLPPIDYVLITHNHYDHLDLPTLARLESAHHPRFIVATGNGKWLRSRGLREVVEMGWWDVRMAGAVRITCVPARHFSARSLGDRNRTLWCGFVIESEGGPIYFAGDSGYAPLFEDIRQRFAPLRLALLPIGAYEPKWFMSPVHMSPEEAVRAYQDLDTPASIAMHFGTFSLGDEGEHEPVEALRRALEGVKDAKHRFWVLDPGSGLEIPPARV